MSHIFRRRLAEIAKLYESYSGSDDDLDFLLDLCTKIYNSTEFYEYEREELYDNMIEAFKNQSQKYYEDSADYYIKIYEKLNDKLSSSKLYEENKFLKKNIWKEVQRANKYFFRENDYITAAEKYKESIDNIYVINDYKIQRSNE